MKFILFLSCICFLSGGCLESQAQFTEMYWKHFGVKDGLPASYTAALVQDKKGFLWCGTSDGLARFDGTHFTTYSHSELDNQSLIFNNVTTLDVLDNGNLVVGTTEGFSEFDYETGKFHNHRIEVSNADSSKISHVLGFCEWPDGKMWVSTYGGTVEWNRQDNSITLLDSSLFASLYGWSKKFIRDPDGYGCWMLLDGCIGHYDYRTKKLERVESKFASKYTDLKSRALEGFTKTPDGKIWYNSVSDSAFYSYDPANGVEEELKAYREFDGEKEPVSVITMLATSDGKMWISSWNDNVRILDSKTKKWHKLEYKMNDKWHLPHGAFVSICETSAGDIWVGYLYGISVHNKQMEAAFEIPVPPLDIVGESPWYGINVLAQHPETGQLFAGTNVIGMLAYNNALNKYEIYSIKHGDYLTNTILSLHWVDGELWCGTRNGLYIFNPNSKSFRHFDPFRDNEFATTGIINMMQTGDTIWFNCRHGRLYRYNLVAGETKKYVHDPDDSTSVFPFWAYSAIAAKDGKLWFAQNRGYSWMDPEDEVFHHKILFPEPLKYGSSTTLGIYQNTDGKLWFSTLDAGTFIIDPNTGEYTIWEHPDTHKFKLPHPLSFDENSIWFGSQEGILRLDKATNKLVRFGYERQMFPDIHTMEAFRLADGRLITWFNHNLVIIDPTLENSLSTKVQPLASIIESSGLKMAVHSNQVTLNSEQNHFTIRFSALVDAALADIVYEYQLVGVDVVWIAAGNSTYASYNNLAGGRYVFKLRARSGEGQWTELTEDLTIIIKKRFVETLLFKGLLLAGLLVILGVIVLWRKRIERRLQRERALQFFIDKKELQPVDEICRDISRVCVEELKLTNCAVFILDDQTNVFNLVSSYEGNMKNNVRVSWAQSFSAATNKPEAVNPQSMLSETNKKTSITTIVHEGKMLGLVATLSNKNSVIEEDDEKTLSGIATVCAGKIASAKAEQEVKQKEAMLAQINSLLAESQLVSLRAQMNPHFVFNCLNSIQESIVMKQYADASLYLNKFSKLFRMVLQNSSKNLITLQEEINVLSLYLDLEHMRFQKSFDYTIDCHADLDTEEIMIPSMLLQPFVENALWHGLMHKDGGRKLSVRFYPKDEEVFVCEIEDNGIGRQRATEIKLQKTQTKTHDSKGIGISMDRLNLIKIKQGKHASVEILDLKNADGTAAGTKVIFELSAYLN